MLGMSWMDLATAEKSMDTDRSSLSKSGERTRYNDRRLEGIGRIGEGKSYGPQFLLGPLDQ